MHCVLYSTICGRWEIHAVQHSPEMIIPIQSLKKMQKPTGYLNIVIIFTHYILLLNIWKRLGYLCTHTHTHIYCTTSLIKINMKITVALFTAMKHWVTYFDRHNSVKMARYVSVICSYIYIPITHTHLMAQYIQNKITWFIT